MTKRFRLPSSDATAGGLLKRMKEAGTEGDVELPYSMEKVAAWSHPERAEHMSPEELAGALEV